jgi:magnesium transporter
LLAKAGTRGSQALALRGITLGDFNSHPVRKLIANELTLGAMNGLLTGIVAGVAMWWSADGSRNDQGMVLGLIILLAMTIACMASGLFGVLVPLTLQRFSADPCTASSIFLTTGTDIAGMGLKLELATVLVL